jgi:hypothetical protein
METQSLPLSVTKMLTGISGFDEITDGGLPRGRTTLVMGGPGCGKTVFALQSLVNGARRWKEAGLFVAFEESTRQLIANAATFGWDLPALERKKLFFLDARLSPDVVKAGRSASPPALVAEARRPRASSAGGESEMTKAKTRVGVVSLRLYVAGNAPNSLRAVANTKAICEEYLTSRYQLEIVDLLQHPKRALADGIIVTPTLLRLKPSPIQRVIGDLSDTGQVLTMLGNK